MSEPEPEQEPAVEVAAQRSDDPPVNARETAQDEPPAPREPAEQVARQPERQPEPDRPRVRREPPPPVISDADLARKLYREAAEATRRRDFAQAVELYERIKQLPKDVQQRDLDIKIANARARMH